MALSNDLISQFVKLTNDETKDKPSNTVYGTVKELNGEKYVQIDGSERLTRASQVTDTKVGDRVIVTIENHTATVTGNISSPSASSERVEDLGGDIQKVAILMAGKIDAEQVVADWAKIEQLITNKLTVSDRLDAAEAVIVTLDATYARFDELAATNAAIVNLEAKDAEITNLFAYYATLEKLEATNAKIGNLEAEDADIRKLFANYATINKLENEYAKITYLTTNYATIVSLDAVDAKIGALDTRVANINTLTSEFISGDTVHTNFANAVIAQLGDAQIKSAMIEDISAAKITSGDIITDKVNVKSQDGRLLISDQTMQISDTSRVRVQIGKDASGDYSINVWDSFGKLMFSKGGITEDAVKDKIIRDDMVKDNANISASKLDINSLFEVINEDGSNTIKSTKVYLDEEGQTLDVSFKSMTTKIDGISVGGRNLLKNTKSFTGITGHYTETSLTGETYQDFAIRYLDCTDMEVSPTSYRDMSQWIRSIDAEGGCQYTFSFYAKGTKIRAHFYSGAFKVVRCESSQGVVKTNAPDGAIDFTLTDEWARYWVTYKVEEENTTTAADPKNVLLRVMGGEKAYACGAKFETGNKATDWTPAPEDVDANINAVMTEFSTKYHDLTIDIESLSSTIISNSQKITNLEGLERGTRNLLPNTSTNDIELGGYPESGVSDGFGRVTTIIPNDDEYVLSFEAKSTVDKDVISCFFHWGSNNTIISSVSSTGQTNSNSADGYSHVTLTTEWKRYWVKYVNNGEATNHTKQVIVGRRTAGYGSGVISIRSVKLEVGSEATYWTPAPEDLGTKTAELTTKYSTLEQTINGLSATVGSHTSTVATLSSQVASLDLSLDDITTRVSKTETDISNVDVNGRNLLINTGQNGTIKLNTAANIAVNKLTHTNVDGLLTLNCSSASTQNEIYYRFMSPVTTQENMYGLKKGGTYTFSGKLKVSTTSGVLTRVNARSQDLVGGWGGGASTVITETDSDEWISFESTFTIRENATCCYTSIHVYFEGAWTGVIQLKDLKFEKGDTATDWTPAPEDGAYAAIVSSAETLTKQTETLLGSYAKKVDLDGYYTKSETKSAIEETAGSITSTVSKTYSTKADLAALKVGGRNLMAGTSLDTVYSGIVAADSTLGYKDIWAAKTIDEVNGTEYVASFEAKADAEIDIRCFFYTPNTTLTSESSTGDHRGDSETAATDGVSVVHITPEWKRYWVKWTQTPANAKKSVIIGRNSSKTINVYIRAVKLEAGNKATDWTPAPEDVETEFGSVRSEIQQLADSISLSVTGSLGQSATIKLTADGQTAAKEIDIDMSKVRQAFANDNTAVLIEAGTVTFNAGTLLINAGNFTLDGSGNIVAKSGTIGSITLWELGLYSIKNSVYSGMASITANAEQTGINNCFYAGSNNPLGVDAKFRVTHDGELYASDAEISGVITTTDDKLEAKLTGGGLRLSYDGTVCGYVTSQLIEGEYQTTSMILRVPYRGVIEFVSESQAGGAVSHYKLHDRPDEESFNREDYKTYTHFFLSTVYILGEVYFTSRTTHNNWMYIKNRNGIGWYTSDGSQDQMISMGTDDVFIVGSKYHNAIFSGDILQLVADGQLQLKSSANSIVYTGASTTSGTSYFNHNTNGTCVLGASDKRWKQLYASSACNTSSDIRLKKNIVGLSDEHSELFDRLQPVQYNMIDGDDRIHYGFVAQQVASAMAELSIDEDELDIVHHDYWIDRETSEPCDEYGIVYDNFIAMLVHEVQKLKREIKTLKGE